MIADGDERFEIVRAGLLLGSIRTNYKFARRMFPTSTLTQSANDPKLWLVQVQFDDSPTSLQAKEVT